MGLRYGEDGDAGYTSGYRDSRYQSDYGYDGPSSDGMSSSSAAGGYVRSDDASAYSRSSYVGGRNVNSLDFDAEERQARRSTRRRSTRQPVAEETYQDTENATRRLQSRQTNRRSANEQTRSRRTVATESSYDQYDQMDGNFEAAANERPSARKAAEREASTRESFSRSSGAYSTKSSGGNRKRALPIVIGAIVALAVIGAVAAFAYVGNLTGRLHEGVDENLRSALVQTDMAKEPFYILLLGTDKSQDREEAGDLGGVYRTDSMMLARIDPVNRKVCLLSIPRDTLVDLDQNGYQRVNAAYAFDGPAGAVKAVSDLAGINISHYAEIDFDGFAAIVDALGGIEVDVPVEIDDWEAGGYVPAGEQVLNGEQALVVCRSRATYADTSAAPDLMRAANQRLVLSAIAHKLLASDVATIAGTVNSVADYVTTDLEINDIIGIAQTMQGLDTADDMYTASFPTDSVYIAAGYAYIDAAMAQVVSTVDAKIEEGYYLLPDDKEWKKMKERMEAGEPPSEGAVIDEATGTVLATAGADAKDTSEKTSSIVVKNATDIKGVAMQSANSLNDAGFVNVTVGEISDNYSYPETLVLYNDESMKREAQMIVDTLGQGKARQNDGSYLIETDFLVIIGADWEEQDK